MRDAYLREAPVGAPSLEGISTQSEKKGSMNTTRETREIVVIGDVHGSAAKLEALLRAAGLVDEEMRWRKEGACLVQTGDLIDRGPEPFRVLDIMRKLVEEAPEAGGEVHSLLGNHEFMALASARGDELMLATWFSENNGGWVTYEIWRRERGGDLEGFLAEFSDAGGYGSWLRERPVMVRVGDFVFSHAGLDRAFPSVDGVNEEFWERFERGDFYHPLLRRGPLWVRDLTSDEVEEALGALGASRMVVGHTPHPGITAACGGRLIYVDVGMAWTRYCEALHIIGDEGYVFDDRGRRRRLF